MAYKEFCSDCDKPLTDKPMVGIPQIIIREKEKQGNATNLHFCDHKCLSSWVVKNTNRPVIHGAQ